MLTLATDKTGYSAGEEIVATITLSLKKPVNARGIYAVLECQETHKQQQTRPMDQYDYDREKELGIPRSTHLRTSTIYHEEVIFRKEVKVAGEGEFNSGEFQARIRLPPDAKPTSREYGHDNKIHVWKLKAKLDIPLALDKGATTEIFVDGLGS